MLTQQPVAPSQLAFGPEPDGPEPSDAVLLARFAAGRDQAAFAGLVRRHGPLVWGVCRRVLGNTHDAEDAFQAAFLVLARKAGSIGRPELLANWLYGVATRVSLKARDAARRHVHERQAEPMAPFAEPLPGVAWEELKGILDEELNRLPEADRAVLVLCYLEGKTHEEAAALLGCPLGSMSWRVSRARESLRKRLVKRGVALSVGLIALLMAAGRADAAPAALAEAAVSTAVGGTASGVIAALAEAVGREAASGSKRRAALFLLGLLFVGSAAGVIAAAQTHKHTKSGQAPEATLAAPSCSPQPCHPQAAPAKE